MSTTCTGKRYAPTTPVVKYPQVEEGNKSWVVADVPNDKDTKKEVNDEVQKKIELLKCKFHQERKLLVKHLPRNVKEQEIAELLNDFKIKKINLANNDEKSNTASVTLENPEVLDEWDNDRQFFLREQSVSVAPTPTEMLLCIARLPFHFVESDFHNLIKEYGEMKMYFLMISERTGISKGYGFVQYASKESALIAKSALNDRVIDTFQLVCDWLDSSHLTFNSLHSKCLYVDNLPRQFRDMSEFRSVFERIIKPPYCQIALKKGCPLDWGLVEYLSPEDAELAQTSCNNYRLRNQPIRVVYFIPGVRAINLMLSLLETPPRVKSAGLLPDPTGPAIRMSIENLSKQNPIFAENLKSIIMHQIQETQQVKENHEDNKRNPASKSAETKTMEGVPQKLSNDIEKIVPPTPPMTPTIMNGVPIISSTVPSVPLLPNTAIPPPVVDKMTYNQQLNLSMKEKYPIMWNDLVGPSLSNGVYSTHPSIVPGTVSPETATPAFAIPTTQIPTSLVHEVMNLPLNVQQNIFSLINNATSLPAQAAMAQTVAPATLQPPPPAVQYSPLSIEPIRIFQNPPPETLVSPPQLQPHQLLTVPTIVSKGVIPTSWASISPFMTPTSVPVFTTAAAASAAAEQWHNIRMSNVMSSQPSTPIGHHFTTGQKRKLLPSPEKSPEGNYIGQHSQGIGGHYADSYFKKKKMY